MLNNTMLVGRVVEKPILEEDINGNEISIITLSIPRNFRNSEGEYDNDFIPILLHGSIAKNANEYCNEGDIVGIKGRLQRLEGKSLQVVAEKVYYLSSRKEGEENDNKE